MNRFFKALLIFTTCMGSIVFIMTASIYIFFPNVERSPVIKVKMTSARLERGKYLFFNVAACAGCHSQRDESRFTMPVIKGTEGMGGERFDHRLGFPGSFTAKNLTPFHLGNWSDGDIYRAITTGVSKDGHALFPIMPYEHYALMDTEDIFSIIAYLRSIKSCNANWPESQFDFPINIIVRTIPKDVQAAIKPDTSNIIAYGKYLVNMASCLTCHTDARRGKIIDSLAFGGGREMPLFTGGVVRSANISPDSLTGIGSWSSELFVNRFKSFEDSVFEPGKVERNQFNTIMPWTLFAKLKTSDLQAIYAYLRTVKPIHNNVTRFSKNSESIH